MSDEEEHDRVIRLPKLLKEDFFDGLDFPPGEPPSAAPVLPFRPVRQRVELVLEPSEKDADARTKQPAGAIIRAGLCETCKHATPVPSSKGSTFVLCDLSMTDASFARYPPLPMIQCGGFAGKASEGTPHE